MSDVRLARVGDVIAHGETIPANVRVLRDKVGDLWERQRGGWILTKYDGTATTEEERADTEPADEARLLTFWAPLKVVEVDPEPQPAGIEPVEPPRHAFVRGTDDCCDAWLATGYDRPPLTGKVQCGNVEDSPCHLASSFHVPPADLTFKAALPATPGPLVLALPEVPAEAVALTGKVTGKRYDALPNGAYSRPGEQPWSLAMVLHEERPYGVTVELTPPREPRTWPKLDPDPPLDPSLDDVRAVDVEGHGTWQRIQRGGDSWVQGQKVRSLRQLRELGEVREVLT